MCRSPAAHVHVSETLAATPFSFAAGFLFLFHPSFVQPSFILFNLPKSNLPSIWIMASEDTEVQAALLSEHIQRLVQDTLKEALPGLAEHLRAAAATPPTRRSDGKSLLRTRPKEGLD